MAQDQRLRHRIAERADAELQGAAVGHGARDMQTNGMIGEVDRLARRGEQREVVAFQQQAKLGSRDLRVARHVRQLGIDLPYQQELTAALAAAIQQIDRDVGIAAETEAVTAGVGGDQLRHHVDAAVDQVAQRVRIVGGDVALLRDRNIQARAGEEEELVDLDIGRQITPAQRQRVGELGIAAEHPLGERPEEAPLEGALRPRLLQGECGEDAQPDRAVGGGTRIERVDHVVGLAEAERQAEHDLAADAVDDRLRDFIRVAEAGRTYAAALIHWAGLANLS